MPTLDRITVYPVKSLDGVDVDEASVLTGGGLEHDRRWRLIDLDGRVMNAKRSPLFHALRAEFDLGDRGVRLRVDPAALQAHALPASDLERLGHMAPDSFALVPGPGGPCGWLSEAFGRPLLLEERLDGGFPDDRDAPGPTVVSTATLVEVGRWFGFDATESRRRFRANLECGGCEAFWEDTLASPAHTSDRPSIFDLPPEMPVDPYAGLPPPPPVAVRLGPVRLVATGVCRRCVVPSRDSRTGSVTSHFRDAFEARRSRSLRDDVDSSGWGHLYRLAVNTRVDGPGGVVRTGALILPSGR